jgi:predicted phosphodiesterase
VIGEDAGVTTLRGLEASKNHGIVISSKTAEDRLNITTRPEIGPVRSRFATMSDLHLGLPGYGVARTTPDTAIPSSMFRAAVAAAQEAHEWGAELLIIKGDITDRGRDHHWEEAAALLDQIDIPVAVVPGNHDAYSDADRPPTEAIDTLGLSADPVTIHDLAGVRIITAHTHIAAKGRGTLRSISDLILDAASTDAPVFLAVHHNLQRTPIPWFIPAGVSSIEARPFVQRLAERNANVFISSGHSHRNRRHHIGPNRSVLYTEVSATSDYPGVWAGYEVSGSAIRQTVRRIARPDVVDWTEQTRRMVGGVWPHWTQGRLDDRCVDLKLR